MILSNISIHDALDRGWLKITPEPSPRRLGEKPGKCPYQTSAVDLRLGNEIADFREGIPATVDLRNQIRALPASHATIARDHLIQLGIAPPLAPEQRHRQTQKLRRTLVIEPGVSAVPHHHISRGCKVARCIVFRCLPNSARASPLRSTLRLTTDDCKMTKSPTWRELFRNVVYIDVDNFGGLDE